MIHPKLEEHVAKMFPGARILETHPLAPDSGGSGHDATHKATGYGEPVRLVVDDRGHRRELVWRIAGRNDLGHDRRSDRAAETLLAFDDFVQMPAHIAPLDVGAVKSNGELVSLRDAGELYLLTTYAPGRLYAEDLRRIARTGQLADDDLARLDALATYLADLHVPIPDGGARYRRAIRDLVGSGEGIYGVIDAFPAGVPGAPLGRLRAIEERCASWRWRLRDRGSRLARTHGDFHPFNIVFDHLAPTMLDASRGACGDPADDIVTLAINFPFFAIDARDSWSRGLGVLWRRWWRRCDELRADLDLLEVAPPYLAWRTLVVCNPKFYPQLSATGRDRLLRFAEGSLAAGRLDPLAAEGMFA